MSIPSLRAADFMKVTFGIVVAAGVGLAIAGDALAQAQPPAPVKATSVPALSEVKTPTQLTPEIPAGPTTIDTNTRQRPLAGQTSSAANEAALLAALKGSITGYVSLPDKTSATLIQAGRDWRETIKGPVRIWGSWLILGMVGLLIVFYVLRGRIRIDSGPSGRTVERFNAIERFVHWLTASSFVVLALSGLNITYGRYVLLPILGPDAFTGLSVLLKYAHNFLAWPFMLGVVLMFVIWVANNLPTRADGRWLMAGGGLFRKGVHPPAGKFNAGQKIVFWSVIVGGVLLTWSGIFLLFPFTFGDIGDMQYMQVLHAVTSLILTSIILAHIYIGTLGMEGAFDAMGTGQVDENWAREHHSLWMAQLRGETAPQSGDD